MRRLKVFQVWQLGTGALSSGNTALAVSRQSAATADFSKLLVMLLLRRVKVL